LKIDASRYSLFLTNPEEFRLRYIWNLTTSKAGGDLSLRSFGRRRGTALHLLTEGQEPDAAMRKALGDDAVNTAILMHEANSKYDEATALEVMWREKEFLIPIPDSPHQMMGRVDCMAQRPGSDPFILDLKGSKHRTKSDFYALCEGYRRSPQVDFYLIAHPEVREFVFRILMKTPATKTKKSFIKIQESTARRQPFQLRAVQRNVHMVCETIEFWTKSFGVEKPWPAAVKLPTSWENYSYAGIYQRDMYDEVIPDGFEPRKEHLDCMMEEEETPDAE
jgi:hypothetical protein